MKTSASVFLTDILPEKRRLFNKVIKNRLFSNSSPEHVFSSLKASGVQGIELLLPSFNRITYKDIEDVQFVLQKHKMPVFSVHQVLRFFSRTRLAEVTQLFHMADMLGAKVIVLHLNCAGKQIFSREYIDTLHSLERKFGIQIGFENREKHMTSFLDKHTWHGDHYPSLLQKTNFHMTLDTTHLGQAGGNIVKFFKKHKNRIVNIHIGDYKSHPLNSSLRPLRYKHLPLGKGELPIQEFLQTLRAEHYEGLITMEIHTNLEGMCDSAEMIRKFTHLHS
jgi:sugar phosphate isomerase/epimerase